MNIAELNTTLRRRFEAVRGDQPAEVVAKEMGIGHVTLITWIAQYRLTRIDVIGKIERWVEAQERALATDAAARA